MLLPIDRVQIVRNNLYAYEFIDMDKESDIAIQKNKIDKLKETGKFKKIIQIDYSNTNYKNQSSVLTFFNQSITNENEYSEHIYPKDFNGLSKLFRKLNNESNMEGNNKSKTLGSAKAEGAGIADSYVQGVLGEVYNESVTIVNFVRHDDNGLEITKDLLADEYTYGFDFDLYSVEKNVIIEFLKRDNQYITNKEAHPNRYIKSNKSKWNSLWKSKEILEAELFLVNYSDNEDECINIIHVIDFNTSDPKILHDVGYLLKNKESLVEWLTLMRDENADYKQYLSNESLQSQIRTQSFWSVDNWRSKLFN